MLPIVLTFGLTIGVIRLFTPFGILYALPVIGMLVGACLAYRNKREILSKTLLVSSALGSAFSFLSWLVSRRDIRFAQTGRMWAGSPSDAMAGFPFHSLELPPSPMGSDTIPLDMWVSVFANHLFWFAFAVLLTVLVIRAKRLNRLVSLGKVARTLCGVLSGIFLLYNLALFTLWFD
jgi:hypothetical protein